MDNKQTWRKKVREYLAIAFGGKCTICGYNKSIAALDYHHINKKEKEKELGKCMSNGHSWTKIVEEARKCTILCCRCHRELHAGVVKLPEKYAKFNEEYADTIKLKRKEYDACPICGEDKWVKFKFCSLKCFYSQNNRFEVQAEELKNMLETMPYTEVAKIFGVSDNAIKKRAKKLGIFMGNRRGYWAKIRANKK